MFDIEQHIKQVECVIQSYLPKEEGPQKILFEAMNYAVNGGGKRLRPILMLKTFEGYERKSKAIEPFMAAMELIHTYSLVHDDLPALDNDDYRRGRKTTHVVFGHAMGILAGDALLHYAFETAVKAFGMDDTEVVRRAFEILVTKPGVYGMIGGQVVDVVKSGTAMTKEELEFVFEGKTAALIEASMMIGAIIGGAKEEEVSKVEEIAKKIGLAFQIQDDILDVTSTSKELGKPVHSDEKNQKTTYVTLYGLEQAQKDAHKYLDAAIEEIRMLKGKHEELILLIQWMADRKK